MGRWTPRYCRSMARLGSRRLIFRPTEQTHQEQLLVFNVQHQPVVSRCAS